MSLVAEALHGIWGAVRIIGHDRDAFEEFNISADGFWRSFSAIIPTAVLAWPLFLSSHEFAAEAAQAEGKPLPEINLLRDYLYLCVAFAAWPVAAALLARSLGVARSYSRYMIAYNWMSVPLVAINLIPPLLHLAGFLAWQGMILPSLAVFIGLAYISWYVALRGLETTRLIALAFLIADYALNFALDALIR
jgi:hypothetical protein